MAAIGLPLLADGLYGGSASPWISRQSLHAFKLGFKHPFSNQDLQFESPLPDDIQAAVLGMGLNKPLG
jgi:23S rRNA pseudouridine1911/1915/1917 synthase